MLQFIHMLQPTVLYKIYYLLAKVTHSYENSCYFRLYSYLDFKNYLLDTWGIFGKVLEVIHSVMVFWLVDENICPFCWLTHIIFGRKVFPWNRIGRQQQGTGYGGIFYNFWRHWLLYKDMLGWVRKVSGLKATTYFMLRG